MSPNTVPRLSPHRPDSTTEEVPPLPLNTAVPASPDSAASEDFLGWARDEVAKMVDHLDPMPTLGAVRVTCGHRWSESDAGIELTFFCVRVPEHPGDCDHGVRDLAHGQLDGAP